MNTVRAKAWTENQRLKAGREDVRDMPGWLWSVNTSLLLRWDLPSVISTMKKYYYLLVLLSFTRIFFLIIWPEQPNDQPLTYFLTASFLGTTKYLQIITLSAYNWENSMDKSIYTIRIQGHKNESTIEKSHV